MFLALDLSVAQDLRPFSRLLWQRKVSHHIAEEDGRLLLAVADSEQVALTKQLFQQWQQGDIQPTSEDTIAIGSYLRPQALGAGLRSAFTASPLTLLLILACCALWLLAPLERPTSLTFALLYPDFSRGTGTIILSRVFESLGVLELLTMLTPMLLHGGIVHLAFNMLWVWELGRRIEMVQGTFKLAVATIVIGLCSNTIQYLWGGGNNFGGMSGVVYGLFAYIWMWQLFDPRTGLRLPWSLILYMLAMLALFTYLDLAMIANAAHMGGFLTGMLLGAVLATVRRAQRALVAEAKP